MSMVALWQRRGCCLGLGLVMAGVAGEPVWAAEPASPAQSGNEVVVVYNSGVPESKKVAEYYAGKRGVPAAQVWGFDLPSTEDITRNAFRDQLQRPLAKKLAEQKLWRVASNLVPASNGAPARVEWRVGESRVRYLVLCWGVPVKISPEPDLKEPGMENVRAEMRRNEAAVDSELAVLPLLEERYPVSGLLRNPVYGATNAASLHPTNGVLMVARLDGPTPDLARGLVDKALLAERQGLWGRAYFDIRSTTDAAYKVGDDWIAGAAEFARRLGWETTVDTNGATFARGYPMSEVGWYMGWYDEHVSGPFLEPGFEFMPGAFAYHLHSFSAHTLRSTNRHWVGPLIALGATASMGSVHEPYLSGTPDLTVFAARFIYNTFSFGEAAMASQSVLSWQTTVVGDPLYRPFGRNPEELHDELVQSGSRHAEWSYLRLLNLNLANGKPATECAALLEQLDLTKRSALLSEKLGDIYGLLGKPSSAIHLTKLALGLDPNPRVRLRLLLNLGERQAALNRDEEAFATFQQVLGDYPNYADKQTVYRRLAALGRKVGKTTEAEKYEAEAARLMPPKQS